MEHPPNLIVRADPYPELFRCLISDIAFEARYDLEVIGQPYTLDFHVFDVPDPLASFVLLASRSKNSSG